MADTTVTRYPGAQPFADDPLSRKLFFGRDRERVSLCHQVMANRLTVLFARSGLGKTSLINAGISQRLRDEGFLPLSVRVNDREAGVLGSIYHDIANRCREQNIEYVPGKTDSLWLFFKTAEFWIGDVLMVPVLILDQFEELFTLYDEVQREAFVDQFSCLARGVPPNAEAYAGSKLADGRPMQDSPPLIRILIGIREDFLANLDDLSDRIPEILNERFRLLPMDRQQAQQALVEPTRDEDSALLTRPFSINGPCRDAVLDFLEQRSDQTARRAASSIEPFQLQLVCQHIEGIARTAQAEASGEVVVGLKDIGGERRLRRVLSSFYQAQLLALPFFQRRCVRDLCSEYLISPHGRRLRLEESEIERLTGVKPKTLQALVESRLLRRDQTTAGDYFELSHDSLVVPVLNSRRMWFLAKAGSSLVPIVVAVLGCLAIVGFAIEYQGDWWWFALTAVVLVYLQTRYVLHRIRRTRDYLRRIRI
jgi:hypothetical protein